jgi:hypothetical protein
MLISLMILFAVQGHTKIIQFAMNAPLDFIIIQLSALLSILFIFSIAYVDSRRRTPMLHRILKFIVVVYLFAVVLGISGYRYTFDLPLPKVTVETTIPGQPVIDGRLLTYINPNWYILRDINDHDDVIALSNDKIISTVIH